MFEFSERMIGQPKFFDLLYFIEIKLGIFDPFLLSFWSKIVLADSIGFEITYKNGSTGEFDPTECFNGMPIEIVIENYNN